MQPLIMEKKIQDFQDDANIQAFVKLFECIGKRPLKKSITSIDSHPHLKLIGMNKFQLIKEKNNLQILLKLKNILT
jgi:hypothetical protein